MSRAAYLASAHLAREKGAFPLFDRDAYLAGETVGGLDADVRSLIAEHGIRNALLTSVAPTGTISLVADNVSSGVEPVFALAYTRKVLQLDGSRVEEEVSDYALRRFRAIRTRHSPSIRPSANWTRPDVSAPEIARPGAGHTSLPND